jgi:hypothetical protein
MAVMRGVLGVDHRRQRVGHVVRSSADMGDGFERGSLAGGQALK